MVAAAYGGRITHCMATSAGCQAGRRADMPLLHARTHARTLTRTCGGYACSRAPCLHPSCRSVPRSPSPVRSRASVGRWSSAARSVAPHIPLPLWPEYTPGGAMHVICSTMVTHPPHTLALTAHMLSAHFLRSVVTHHRLLDDPAPLNPPCCPEVAIAIVVDAVLS